MNTRLTSTPRNVQPSTPSPTPMARYIMDSTQNALSLLSSSMDHKQAGSRNGLRNSRQTEETNPLATIWSSISNSSSTSTANPSMMQRLKKEEVESKIMAWETAKIAKINNRFKREDVIISGRENERIHKASSWMKEVEGKLEERRAKAKEKMENRIARARKKAEERRASSEAKKETQVARVLEIAHFMRANARLPAKCCLF